MITRLKDLYRALKKRLIRTPRLESRYIVSDGTTALATLSDPGFVEMFWTSFLLTPLVKDPSLLEKLYSDSFWWGSEIRFTEAKSSSIVRFTIAQKDSEEDIFTSGMDDKPTRVVLRGPYYPESD
jgi:hypothetical protein